MRLCPVTGCARKLGRHNMLCTPHLRLLRGEAVAAALFYWDLYDARKIGHAERDARVVAMVEHAQKGRRNA
jgi:hypothetical protein